MTHHRFVRSLLVAGAATAVLFSSPEVHAKCVYRPPQAFSGHVKSCKAVDVDDPKVSRYATQYRGLVLVVDDGRGQEVKGWIAEGEGASCTALRSGARLKATMSFACCDGDPNPPCYIGTSNIFTEVEGAKGAPPDPPAPPSASVASDPPTVSAAPPPASSTPPPAVVSDPAPGARNCGCRVVGTTSGDARWAGMGVVAALVMRMSRRRRSQAR